MYVKQLFLGVAYFLPCHIFWTRTDRNIACAPRMFLRNSAELMKRDRWMSSSYVASLTTQGK